jgi:hypothetical protein
MCDTRSVPWLTQMKTRTKKPGAIQILINT